MCYHSNTSTDFAKALSDDLKCIKPELKICYHEEFIPGRTIIQNITTSLRESIKVIVILSKDFLSSKWCEFEA